MTTILKHKNSEIFAGVVLEHCMIIEFVDV